MTMSITEANALLKVLDWLGYRHQVAGAFLVEEVPDDDAAAALTGLAQVATARLQLSVDVDEVARAVQRLSGRLAGAESDGAAQAVCQALARHVAKGGSIPWPSIERPFAQWQAAHTAAQPQGAP